MSPDHGDSDDDYEPGEVTLDRRSKNGYLTIKHNGHRVYVHRLVAVAEYGTHVLSGDVDVHHKGLNWINNPENLEVIGSTEHAELHAEEQHNIDDTSYRRKEILEYYYEDQELTITEIADEFGVSQHTIHTHMCKHGIDRRSSAVGRKRSRNPTRTENRDPQTTLFDYEEVTA